MKETMTVHQALCDIKVSDSKIADAIGDLCVVTANRQNATKVNGIDPKEFTENAKSGYQKVISLINRNNALKRAINDYNAKTIIQVGDKSYSVAEAIYMMNNGLNAKRSLINCLTATLKKSERTINEENGDKLTMAAERNATIQFGSDKHKSEEMLEFIENYKEKNQYILVDPLKIRDKIEELQAEVDDFASKVDAAIQVSNATTEITIEY